MEVKIAQVTPVFLNEEDTAKLILFNQHYKLFDTLLKSGVFDVKNGKAILNFDHLGALKSINIEQCTFRS